jgi:hypothetical protein
MSDATALLVHCLTLLCAGSSITPGCCTRRNATLHRENVLLRRCARRVTTAAQHFMLNEIYIFPRPRQDMVGTFEDELAIERLEGNLVNMSARPSFDSSTSCSIITCV